MTRKEKSDIKRKLDVINYEKKVGNINKACRHYDSLKSLSPIQYSKIFLNGDIPIEEKQYL